MLRTRSSESQRVVRDALSTTAGLETRQFRDMLGNLCDGLVATGGELVVRSEIVANVDPHVMVDVGARRTPFARLPAEALHYTLSSRYCPADKLQQLARDVTRGCQAGYPEVQAICDYVRGHLKYRYGVSDGSTDALDTLQAGAGVCRDFAHVAIALCRSIDIPARMVAGYLHGREPMDMHAWFEAHVGDRWYTFDPSEPQLRGGRIVLAHGRDAADVAFVTSYGDLTLRAMSVSVREQLCTAIASGRRSAAVREAVDGSRPALLRTVESARQRRA
ncbi:MAG TPA: transglutaminase family protein [Polyangiales bacterium]|nr:transglutaminase family protein [Polyangiales bacterium]